MGKRGLGLVHNLVVLDYNVVPEQSENETEDELDGVGDSRGLGGGAEDVGTEDDGGEDDCEEQDGEVEGVLELGVLDGEGGGDCPHKTQEEDGDELEVDDDAEEVCWGLADQGVDAGGLDVEDKHLEDEDDGDEAGGVELEAGVLQAAEPRAGGEQHQVVDHPDAQEGGERQGGEVGEGDDDGVCDVAVLVQGDVVDHGDEVEDGGAPVEDQELVLQGVLLVLEVVQGDGGLVVLDLEVGGHKHEGAEGAVGEEEVERRGHSVEVADQQRAERLHPVDLDGQLRVALRNRGRQEHDAVDRRLGELVHVVVA